MWRSSKGREQVWHSAHFQCRKVPKPGLSVWKKARQSTGTLEESSPYHSDPSCRWDGCAINLLWHWWSLSSLLLQLKALATIAAMTAIASSVVGALKSVTWNAEFRVSCPTWNMPFPPSEILQKCHVVHLSVPFWRVIAIHQAEIGLFRVDDSPRLSHLMNLHSLAIIWICSSVSVVGIRGFHKVTPKHQLACFHPKKPERYPSTVW